MPYSTSRILNIPIPTRDQVNVGVEDGLPGGFAAIYPQIETGY
jgi:hypothetical protein